MSNLIVIPLTPREQDINNIIYNKVGNADNPQNQIGAFIGNGKIGLFTDFNHINTQKTVISTDLKYSDGKYKSNIVETFNTSKVMFFNEYINDNVTETMIQQNLNISYSTFTSELEIRKNTGAQVNVNTDIYCPYQMPYMTILTLNVIPIRADDINEEVMNIPIIHEVYTKGNIIDITYNNNYIYIEGYGSVYILSGTGKDINNKNKDIAFACGYIFDNQVENLGFNILKNESNSTINRFQIPNTPLNSNVKMTILSAHMTSHDFENPIEELKHMIINSITKVNSIRAKHLVEWGRKWDTNVNIVPKTGITSDLTNDILALNQIIRIAIYNVYSCTRENINTEINPFNLHLIDTEGILMYEGDIWFLPLLCILKPDIARSILEERYNTLNMARQISNGYGYSGAKFPYNTDIIGYRNLIYYDTKGSVSVFNNALISINVWNYYRVTKDKEWLQNKGYPIMKDIANFFVSLITVENNKYSLDNVYSLSSNIEQSNNSFTNNMVKLSLKYVIEASYELNIKPSEKFIKYMNGLEIKIINPEDFNDVIGINNNTPENTSQFIDILDILFILMPFYSDIYFDQSIINRGNNSLKRNLDYYINKINAKFIDHPYNDALLAIVYGMYAQSDENYVHTFDYFLHKFIEKNIVYNNDSGSVNAWLNMKAFGSNTYNSLISNAMLVLVILFGVCQTKIEGGITPSKFYYEEMKINILNTANMPCHWDRISINNIGSHNNLKSFIVKNRILFTTLESCSNPAPL